MSVAHLTPDDVASVAPIASSASAPRTNPFVDASSASREDRDVVPAFIPPRRSSFMSPEKVAVLVVTLLITALSAAAILGADRTAAVVGPGATSSSGAAAGAPPPARRSDPVESLTYDDLRQGRFRPGPPKTRAKDPESNAAAAPAPIVYQIKRGDSLARIARRELGSERKIGAIVELNPGLVPDKLIAGNTIKLPAKTSTSAASTAAKSAATKSTPAKKPARGATKPGAVKPRTV
jgi:LysM repeat protein